MNKNNLKDKDLALALRALAHPVRLDILRIIAQKCDENCCCTDVTRYIDLAQSTTSQHLKTLLEAGLIKRKSLGTKNCYTISFQELDSLQNSFNNYLSKQIKEKTISSE